MDYEEGYVRAIRKKVGHDPIMLCGASVIVEDARGQLLLQKRADNGCWGYSGGAVEMGESVEDAAGRELFEETGIIADELMLIGTFSGAETFVTYPNGDMVFYIDIIFLCRKFHGELNPQPDEVSELRFFPRDALPAPLSPPIEKPLLRYLAGNMGR